MFAGNFAPAGWRICNGDALPISEFDALYTLLGTTYGGDGVTTFNLPDLRGRTPIHQGQGPGLTMRVIGQTLGAEAVALTPAQMPAHFHPVAANSAAGDSPSPTAGCVWAGGSTKETQYSKRPSTASMSAAATTPAGDGAPHPNMMPFQAVSFIIAVEGIFPSQG
jgi:microcystin-dependent protein